MLKLIWYGRFEFGDFKKGSDLYPCAIVHEIEKKIELNEEDIEVYLDTYGYESYLVPSEYNGELLFSKHFIKGVIDA